MEGFVRGGDESTSSGLAFQENERSRGRQYARICDSNIGFQLLKKAGWKEGTGLGVAEQGQLHPLETHQKLDKRGIGAERRKKEKKIDTGQGVEANDPNPKPKKKILSKAAKRVAEEEARFREREFAIAFYREWNY